MQTSLKRNGSGGDGAPQWAEVEHESHVLQDLAGDADELPSLGLPQPGLRAGLLPRRGAGETQVRQDRLERSVRLQRV